MPHPCPFTRLRLAFVWAGMATDYEPGGNGEPEFRCRRLPDDDVAISPHGWIPERQRPDVIVMRPGYASRVVEAWAAKHDDDRLPPDCRHELASELWDRLVVATLRGCGTHPVVRA